MCIKERLNKTILSFTEFEDSDVTISEETDLFLDLGFDSIKIMQLIIALEEDLNIAFNKNLMIDENLYKYNRLLNIVNEHLERSGNYE